jgi:hypothetical protein
MNARGKKIRNQIETSTGHEISPDRAKEIAMMVMVTNASRIYNLGLTFTRGLFAS